MFNFMRGSLFGPLFVFEGENGGGGGSGGGTGGGENMVPQSRFSEVTRERQAEKERADALQAKLDEKEAEGATELQKAITRAEKAEAERDTLKGTVGTMKRDAVLRSAIPAEAIDADAAAAMLATGTYGAIDPDKPETVTAAVDALKTAKPKLFTATNNGDQNGGQPQGFGGGGSNNGGSNNGGGNGGEQQGEPASERESMGRGILGLLKG